MIVLKWEYNALSFDAGDYTAVSLDEFGDKGWEMVSCHVFGDGGRTFYFKRPLVVLNTEESPVNLKWE